VRYRIVDVFSPRALAGNALCVVLDDCPEELMLAIAREVNLSETTFPSVTARGRYRNRIFTPTTELPFAGHPSLGTAWVLGPGRWEQTTSGAVVTVTADETGAVMTQPEPEITEVEGDGTPAAFGIAGVDGAFVATAAGNRLLLVPTSADLSAARPDEVMIKALCERHDTILAGVVRRLDDGHLHVRVFVPRAGIAEDPGTGGAAGPIGVLARRLWTMNADMTIQQGDEIGRPCRIEVHASDGDLTIGGAVTKWAEGHFELPRG
jgi:trans-2,3-dihydro-3-hydroxyanthranilate isomerase